MCSTRQRLATLLREERNLLGLSLRQAASKAQIAPSTLSRWEAGTCVPRVPELEALLSALEMPTESVRRILASLDAPRAARAIRSQHLDTGETILSAPTGGMLLRALRHKAKLSLTEVAHRINVAPSTVSRWEAATAHPAEEILDPLMDLLHASDDERQCLIASGVAKIKAPRRLFDVLMYQSELQDLEESLESGGDPRTELRLLELQSELWWALDQSGAHELFRQAQLVYAKFLCTWSRFSETTEQAQSALETGYRWDDGIGVAAHRLLARADVYRWASPRPHLGLYILQPILHSLTESTDRGPVLTDMSEYSRLAGRSSEALNYASRAMAAVGILANSEAEFHARIAAGLAYAALGDADKAVALLEDEPTDTQPQRAQRLIARVEAFQRMGLHQESESNRDQALRFLEVCQLLHLVPSLHRVSSPPSANLK